MTFIVRTLYMVKKAAGRNLGACRSLPDLVFRWNLLPDWLMPHEGRGEDFRPGPNQDAPPDKKTFDIPEDFSLENFIGPSFGVYQGEPVYIKVWFHQDVAGYIKEKIWHESQQIHPQDDGSIIFESEVAGTEEIKFWIMTWGAKAVVLEPSSLREEIRTEAEMMVNRYSGNFVAEETPSYGRGQNRPLQRG